VSPLVVMLLLTFLLVIALSLTLWAALTLFEPPRALRPRPTRSSKVGPPAPARPSNDEIRGARATVAPHQPGAEDPFESFRRAEHSKRDE